MNVCRILVIAVAFLIALTGIAPAQQYVVPQKRKTQVINKGWKFIQQDVSGAQATNFAGESSWSSVHLPHYFDRPYWKADLPTAARIGWYRKHFTIDQSLIGSRRIFIEFEAAFLIAQVYVNGTLVGTHTGGYTGFSYDITSNVHAGDNAIAVRLDANWNPKVAPRAGGHIFIGGIYRDVSIVVTDPLHVTWYGTFVTTPQATATSATVQVKTEIKNSTATSKTCKVISIVVDAAGAEVTRVESTRTISAGTIDSFTQVTPVISNPRLWTPDTNQATPPAAALNLNQRPYMYKVYTEVYDGTTLTDNFESPLGIRTIAWNRAMGFALNGKKMWLKGANCHQDHAGWGMGITNTGSFLDVKLLKDAGFNFIRGSHYPHDPAFSDACDRLGMILWSEIPFWGGGGFGPEPTSPASANWITSAYPNNTTDQASFEQNLIQQYKEMVRIHRNHPSVTIWSIGNEFGYSTPALGSKVLALVSTLQNFSHAEDPTRPVGQGIGFGSGPSMGTLVTSTDVVGLNASHEVCAYTVNNTKVPLSSEYGSCSPVRGGSGDNYDGCFFGGTINCSPAVAQVDANGVPLHLSWRPGVTIWAAMDYGINYGGSFGNMGFMDHARVPKRRYYYYRNLYAGIPETRPSTGTAAKLLLTKNRDTITDDGQSDVYLQVQVQDANGRWISSAPSITLTDKSGKGLFPSTTTGSPTMTFTSGTVEHGVVQGLAAIEYRCYDSTAGLVTIEATATGLTPSSVQVYVKHIGYDLVGTLPQHPYAMPVGPVSAILKVSGDRFTVPGALRGRKAVIATYDLRGRLVGSEVRTIKSIALRRNSALAEGVVIIKVRAVE